MPARRLVELGSAGRLRGLELHVAKDEPEGLAPPSLASPSSRSTAPVEHEPGGPRLLAGGILLGLLPSEGASERAATAAAATRSTGDDAAWIWIACMLTTRELVVYASEAALWPILRALTLLA